MPGSTATISILEDVEDESAVAAHRQRYGVFRLGDDWVLTGNVSDPIADEAMAMQQLRDDVRDQCKQSQYLALLTGSGRDLSDHDRSHKSRHPTSSSDGRRKGIRIGHVRYARHRVLRSSHSSLLVSHRAAEIPSEQDGMRRQWLDLESGASISRVRHVSRDSRRDKHGGRIYSLAQHWSGHPSGSGFGIASTEIAPLVAGDVSRQVKGVARMCCCRSMVSAEYPAMTDDSYAVAYGQPLVVDLLDCEDPLGNEEAFNPPDHDRIFQLHLFNVSAKARLRLTL